MCQCIQRKLNQNLQDFTGEKDLVFCGVFDGHGPSGHRVARRAREVLPSKLSKAIKKQPSRLANGVSEASVGPDYSGGNPLVSRWETVLVDSFQEMDQELGFDSSVDSFCSGTTAVTVIKQVRGGYFNHYNITFPGKY